MYLAEHTINGRKKYIIRTSRYNPETKCWQSSDLYDLGRSPWEYIEYPGGNAFYIKDSVCQQLAAKDAEYDPCELEELFWRFIRKEIRQKIEPFYCRGRKRSRNIGWKENEAEVDMQVFDKRRMYYLRSGAVDQRRIGLIPPRYFKSLLK